MKVQWKKRVGKRRKRQREKVSIKQMLQNKQLQRVKQISERWWKEKSIMTSIMLTSIIPVLLMILLGIVSYQTAAKGILNKCEESVMSTVTAGSDYFGVVCDTISSKSAEIMANATVRDFYLKYYDKKNENYADALQAVKSLMGQVKAGNKYLFSYSIISKQGKYVSSLTGTMEDGNYELFMESEEGRLFAENSKLNSVWLGYHNFVDENLKTVPDKYAFAYIQKMPQNDVFLIVDIEANIMKEMLKEIDTGDGSIKALISSDGREIGVIQGEEEFYSMTGNEETRFLGTDFYLQSLEKQEAECRDVTIDGTKYLYLYAPISGSNISFCVLVPQKSLLSEVKSIQYITVVLIVVAGAIALYAGSTIARSIRKTMKDVVGGLKKAETGDLSVRFETKRKDEFQMLTQSLNNTLGGICRLVQETRQFGETVNGMSGDLAEYTSQVNDSMQQVCTAVDEMAQGSQHQAEESDNSNRRMESLFHRISGISERTTSMGALADTVMAEVSDGQSIITGISEKSDETITITKALGEEIRDIESQSLEIQNIVSVINGIAGQTNLLSLNASIEAARAGAYGRGFSVVAEEIRKLADQSKESSKQIQEIIAKITETTKQTGTSARQTEEIILNQVQSIQNTVGVFLRIKESTEKLVSELHQTLQDMENVTADRTQVSDSIQNISAISEETAASIEEVTASLNEEMHMVESIARHAESLKQQMAVLNGSMDKFVI